MDRQQIIMNFSVPPSSDDLAVIAREILTTLPEELLEFCEGVEVHIEELADEAIEDELDLDDPYDLFLLYRNGKEISPGVERKTADGDDLLIVYRRPLLDYWCECEEDINLLFRQLVVEELGRVFEFSDEEVEDMVSRHYQGLL